MFNFAVLFKIQTFFFKNGFKVRAWTKEFSLSEMLSFCLLQTLFLRSDPNFVHFVELQQNRKNHAFDEFSTQNYGIFK